MTVHTRRLRAVLALTLAAIGILVVMVPQARAFDPAVEAKNFSKIEERQSIYNTAEYQALLRQVGAQNLTEAAI